ncbi:MAG: hypothetical protein HYU36_22200 [Planctomycetes bacterium]|nr:hypothetical protein [Planctomycetota bacterium]
MPDAYVRAMEIGPDHRVWVGTYGGGVAELFTP